MKDLGYINRSYIEQVHMGKLFGHKRRHNSHYESIGILLDAYRDVESAKKEIKTLVDLFVNEVDETNYETQTLIKLFNKSMDLTASALILSIRASEALSTQFDKKGQKDEGVKRNEFKHYQKNNQN